MILVVNSLTVHFFDLDLDFSIRFKRLVAKRVDWLKLTQEGYFENATACNAVNAR